jgi:hypothetical protein
MFNKNPPALPFPPIFISTYFIMPYSINKLARGSYEVVNSKTGKIHAKHTSLAKAKAQVRLLGMKDGMKGGIELTPEIVKHLDNLREQYNPNPQQYHRILQRLTLCDRASALKRIFQEEVPPVFQSRGRLNPLHQPRLSDATTGHSESPYSSDGHSSGESDDAPTVSSLTYSGNGRRIGGIRLTPHVRDLITLYHNQLRPNVAQLKDAVANVMLLDDKAIADDQSDLPQMIEACFKVAMGMESNVPLSSIPFTKGKGRMRGGLTPTPELQEEIDRLYHQYLPTQPEMAVIMEHIHALPDSAVQGDLPEMIETCFRVGMDMEGKVPNIGEDPFVNGKGYSGGATYGEPVSDSRGNFVVVPPNYNHGSLPFF